MEGSMDICDSGSGHNNDNVQKESVEDEIIVRHLTDVEIKTEREDKCHGITLEEEYMVSDGENEVPMQLKLSVKKESVEDEIIVSHPTDVEITMTEIEDKCHGITLEEEYMELFPKGTHICKMSCKINSFKEAEMVGEFKLKCSSKEEFKIWLQHFQNITMTTWVIGRTVRSKGEKILYKGFYNCQHHAGYKLNMNKYKSKSTDCKAGMQVTIARNPEEYRCRSKDLHKHPSEMQTTVKLNFNHNHGINRAEALKYRKPTAKVVKSLETAFENGITPGLALTNLKRNLKEQYGESYHQVAADRAICPDTTFVYHLFEKYSRKNPGLTDDALKRKNVAKKKRKKSIRATRPIAKNAIEMVSNILYRVKGGGISTYFVHTNIGTCTCQASLKGYGPCTHKAAVAKYFPETEHTHLFNSGQELPNSEFLLPLTVEPPEAAEPFQRITQYENENEEDSDLDTRQEDEPEPYLEDNCAKIKEAEEKIENALAILKIKLQRALHDDVSTLYPVLTKFEQNINRVETQGQLVSSINSFGKNVGSTSATATRRKSKDTSK